MKAVADLTRLPAGSKPPWLINMIVEIPQGGTNKYEYDPDFGLFRLDRVLHSAVHYPMAYGFVPSTLADDGDPMDILVMTNSATFTGCLIEARPVGMFHMRDEKGEDEKVIAVPAVDPRYDSIKTLQDMRPHRLKEVEHFFSIYKDLEGKPVEILGWADLQETHEAIGAAIEKHKAKIAEDEPAPVEVAGD